MIAKPSFSVALRDAELDDSIRELLESQQELEGYAFVEGELNGLETTRAEFTSCGFSRCTLRDCKVKRFCFVDCVFDHCDLSNLCFENATFQRVKLVNCRLTGSEWIKSALMNLTFSGCGMDYVNFAECKLEHVLWDNCRIRESTWSDVRGKDQSFKMCDLSSAQIHFMPMTGLDMTTCTLDGLSIDPHDLRGMRVTAMQALMFSRMLGLEVEE